MASGLPSSHLIVVAGHAVYLGGDPVDDAAWALQPFQAGEPPSYIAHIRRGIELAAADSRSLLVFSGGPSRRDAGERSESASYRRVAQHYRWWEPGVAERAVTEEYARDSFENLVFGICRFRECADRYPERITVVSWEFKRERFALHREAVRWPASRFDYEGVRQPADLDAARRGEATTIDAFRRDPYGTSDPALTRKRDARNPLGRRPPYETSCPEVAALLRHRGPEQFRGPLPWAGDARVGRLGPT